MGLVLRGPKWDEEEREEEREERKSMGFLSWDNDGILLTKGAREHIDPQPWATL